MMLKSERLIVMAKNAVRTCWIVGREASHYLTEVAEFHLCALPVCLSALGVVRPLLFQYNGIRVKCERAGPKHPHIYHLTDVPFGPFKDNNLIASGSACEAFRV